MLYLIPVPILYRYCRYRTGINAVVALSKVHDAVPAVQNFYVYIILTIYYIPVLPNP